MQALQGSMTTVDDGDDSVAFAPSDLAGLMRWYKADALALNDNDAIGTWADSSSSAKNATQATPTAKPTYKANIQNSLAIARFDGGDSLNFEALALTNFTVFAVGKRASNAAVLYPVGNGIGSELLGHLADDRIGMRDLYIFVGSSAIDTATFDIYEFYRSGSTPNARRNGADVITSGSLSYSLTISMIGGRNGTLSTGDIGEIIIYNVALASDDRTKVRSYLASKWGISI